MRLIVMLVSALALLSTAHAQTAPLPQTAPPTCEVQLEEARTINIMLRKQKAQAEFQAASVEEMAALLNKKVVELETKAKVVEKK